jgi:UDP-galactopyranose mutase
MVKNMIFEKNNIDIRLDCSYCDLLKIDDIAYDKIVWTGAIDQFFEYKYGKLPYRSIDFKFGTSDASFDDAGTHNYPNNFDYTRETSFGRIQGNTCNKFTVKEFPTDYELGKNDPYYPIPNSNNKDLYLLYKNEAKKIENKVIFTGRLGTYQYYDMHMVVGQSLKLFQDIALGNR